MVEKRPKRNPMPDWAKESLPPASPPGVEVQVYRHRQDPRKPPLDFLIPFYATQQRWGGGKYEFRFRWRDEEGRKKQIRSRIGHIEGLPLPKR